MVKETREILADRVRWIFGDVAERIIKLEEETLRAHVGKDLTPDEIQKIASDIRELANRMAGPWIADRVHEEVVTALEQKKGTLR